jgi:hypothetical protein
MRTVSRHTLSLIIANSSFPRWVLILGIREVILPSQISDTMKHMQVAHDNKSLFLAKQQLDILKNCASREENSVQSSIGEPGNKKKVNLYELLWEVDKVLYGCIW